MYVYVIKRIIAFIPTVILVSIIAFVMLRIVPGDPAVARLLGPTGNADYTQADLDLLRAKLGTDRSLVVQYGEWAFDLLRGDMGDSLIDDSSVRDEIERRWPVSLELAIGGILISMVFALPLGIISAVRQNTWVDYLGRTVAIVGVTIPLFVFAVMLVFLLVVVFDWLPPLGYVNLWDNPATNMEQMIFPIMALSLTRIGYMARITRSGMLEVMREDYVRTARAKGLKESVVIGRHALQNAMLPVLTIAAFQFGILLGGTVVIENIFRLPGVGQYLLSSLTNRDYTAVQGVVMTIAGGILIINLLVDLAYGMLDPRIRYA